MIICRKLYPDRIDAVWDELVADAVGIRAAFGRFDAKTEKIFLGIEGNRFAGGRLENYADVDKVLKEKVLKVLDRFQDIIAHHHKPDPYELAIILEEEKDTIWK